MQIDNFQRLREEKEWSLQRWMDVFLQLDRNGEKEKKKKRDGGGTEL